MQWRIHVQNVRVSWRLRKDVKNVIVVDIVYVDKTY